MTTSLLAEQFRKTLSKSKDIRIKSEAQPTISYPTGFISFDCRNGSIAHGKKDGQYYKYMSIGIQDGSANMVIGGTNVGKSTFVSQIAGGIVRPFPNAMVVYDNVEVGMPSQRKQQLLGFTAEEYQASVNDRDTGITAENFYERLTMIHDIKIANPEQYMYNTGEYDMYGEPIFKMEPTVYILDSLAMLTPEKLTEEEQLSGQMSTTAAAKTNASVFRRIIPKLKAANIILFVINHINEDVNISIFKKKPKLTYLKQGETIPGGNTPLYVSNLIIRLDADSKIKEGEGFDVDGTIVNVTLLKSRNNKANQSVKLVFNQESGFDYDLSLLLLLKEHKKLGGAGAYLTVGDCNVKFAQKQFKTKLAQYPELQEAVNIEVSKILKEMLSENSFEEVNKSVVSDNILASMTESL